MELSPQQWIKNALGEGTGSVRIRFLNSVKLFKSKAYITSEGDYEENEPYLNITKI